MIPILYAGNETNFLNNGLGRLSDAIKCTVEEERNGTYELEMTYPITGIHFEDIQESNIILARSEDGGVNQAFIIYKISKPLNGIVTINAQHISYLLNGFVVMPFTASSLADAMSKINTNAVLTTGFTFSTDVSITKPFTLDAPRSIRSLLGGEEGSLLDTYGGHDYYFNNFNVSLLADRGHDNGVTIRYGKNLTDLKAVSDMTNVYTGIVPFWADSEGGNPVYVDGYVVYSEHASTYPYKYIKPIDFSSDFETAPSKAQLLARAQSYLANNDGWKIKSNIEVSFVSLAQTEEYKNVAPLERVKLCDTVTVEYTKLGVSFKTKVIRTVYNVLLERYDSIELGDTTYTLAQAILQANDTPTLQETTSAIQSAVQNATKLIRGGLGGHVVMMADGNGLPQEILIMDTDDITTAQKVWRWNLGGLGYSSDGYEGDYGTAITMDGQIVASFITTGTLNAAVIKAGTISDVNGLNSWNLQTGAFSLQAGATVGGKTVSQIATENANAELTAWITSTYSVDKQTIEGQIDGKAETWHQSADPASAWTTSDEKSKHVGDLWYKTTDDTTWYYQYDSGTQTYSWVQQNVPTAVFDQIDGKAQIFITQPTPPYNVGDLWCKGTSDGIYNCVTKKEAGEAYSANDWQIKNNYVDSAAVNTAISTYDTSLNQKKVFDKLTQNGTKQGIFLDEQTGDLYVNGAWIQANTISANALTAEAKEQLQENHNYLGNIFNDISLWHTDGNEVTFAYETIDNVKYLVIDCTAATGVTWNNVVYTPVKLVGDAVLDVHFVYSIDRQIITTSSQRFPVLKYMKNDGNYYYNNRQLPAQTIPADTDFTWDISLNPTNTNADEQAYFGFYPIVGCKMYFKEITATSSIDDYTTAGLKFNSDGMEVIASKLEANTTHNYLPYDLWSNINRLDKLYSDLADPYFITESGTKYIVLDGAGLSTFNYTNCVRVDSDYIAKPTFTVHLAVKFDTAFTVNSNDFRLFYFSYTDANNITRWNPYIQLPNNTTYDADTEYEFTQDLTLGYDAKSNFKVCIAYIPSVKMYIKAFEVTGTEENYKQTTLSVTSNGVDSVVQAGSIISTINQSAEQVTIEASKINLTGDVSLRGAFTAYDPNDLTNYVDMTEGEITVYNNSDAKFAVTCDSLITNAGAGIYFGDLEDPVTLLRYTSVTQDMVRTPYLYIRADGSHDSGGTPPSGAYFRCEGDAYFYGDIYVENNSGLTVDNIVTPANAAAPSVFWYEVDFKGNVFNSTGGLVFVSDKRKKRNIKDLVIDKAKSFIMALKPKSFKFTEDISTSGRYHHGFIAQEVKEAMQDDWGVYVYDEKRDFNGLRYDELIADMVAVIQDQEKRIEALERAIHDKSNNQS